MYIHIIVRWLVNPTRPLQNKRAGGCLRNSARHPKNQQKGMRCCQCVQAQLPTEVHSYVECCHICWAWIPGRLQNIGGG